MVCEVGTEEAVLIRRTGTDLRDDVFMMERELTNGDTIPCFSGSKAEGFRFKTSDEDWMYVYRKFIVIPSSSYASLYDRNTTVDCLMLMDNEMTKPGFTLLRMMDMKTFIINKGNCPIVRMLNRHYISSKLWREMNMCPEDHDHEMLIHGPCATAVSHENEYDWAHCLKCEYWPSNARSCIQRLHQSSWLSGDIIRNIVSDGVLFVPIGAKQSCFEDIEWRMSFSLAEKRLIHSMNHTQFLCYGLLKIFLKEAIDSEEEVKGLLCSYFLKTALFWEITASPNHWNSSSLLCAFWKCFCRLIQWVSYSYCPSFFVPENNMFEGKIEGQNRVKLLTHLSTLHQEGYKSLIRCPSLAFPYMDRVMNSDTSVNDKAVCKGCIAQDLMKEGLGLGNLLCFSLNTEIQCFLLHCLMNTTNNGLKRFMTKHWLFESLIELCVSSQSNPVTLREGCNSVHYSKHKQRMNVFNQCHADSACHYLYQAMECYNFGIYSQTLQLAQLARKSIFSKHSVFTHRAGCVHDMYRKLGNDDLTIDTAMKKSFVDLVRYKNNIPELFIEAFTCRNLNHLPAATCALFLQYLSYNKLELQPQRDEALLKLYHVIKYDAKNYIDIIRLDISWQILGICQQMSGDNRAAYHSFLKALQYKTQLAKKAVFIRLGTLLAKYF